MLECIAFEEVFSGDSSGALSQAIDAAVEIKNDLEFRARLAQLADENDWDERARAMEAVFTGKADKVRLNDVQNLIVQCH
jgi:DNA-binding transcriptional regulator/RsmH inhibitor MraZ